MELNYNVNRDFRFSEFTQSLAERINSERDYTAVCARENAFEWKINVSVKDARYAVKLLLQDKNITINVKNAANIGHIATMAAGAALCMFIGNKYNKYAIGSLSNTNHQHSKNQEKYKGNLEYIVSAYSANYFKK